MGYKFLFVDDSTTVRSFLAKLVAIAGFQVESVEHAANGLEAIKVLKSKPVDLIITDLHMPVMGGLQMVKILAVDPVLRQLPLVILSGEGSEARLQELRDAGVRHFLRKPVTPEAVRQVLNQALGKA